MPDASEFRFNATVAGFGSYHGDDQAGWHVVNLLRRQAGLPARLAIITEGTQLLDQLGGCQWLVVVDGCRGANAIGAVARFDWPDPRIRQHHSHSTHGVGLCNALELAERLGCLPPSVEVYGIEIGCCQPFDEISNAVTRAAASVAELVFGELCEMEHARTVAGQGVIAAS